MEIENANQRFKKGVVSIGVDDERSGTGFCVQENLIFTCAHVIDEIASSPPQSKFIQVRVANSEVESVAEIVAWRAADDEDIALLRCEFAPEDISVIRLKAVGKEQSQPYDSFGYPQVEGIDGINAEAEIRGDVKTQSGWPLIQLDSKELTRGFSGAPLIERETGRAIGMVSMMVRGDVEHLDGRLNNAAFAIPVSEIAEIFSELKLEPITLEEDHQRAIEKLRQDAIAELKKSSRAMEQLAETIKARLNNDSPSDASEKKRPDEIANALFNSPLNDVLDVVLTSYHALANNADIDHMALNAVVSFGSHLFPAIYDENQLRDIRASIKDRSFLVLPATTKRSSKC